MKRIRHTAEQIIRKLNTAEKLIAQGKNVAEVVCAIEMAAVLRLEDIDERWLPNRLETAAWRQLSHGAQTGVAQRLLSWLIRQGLIQSGLIEQGK